MPLMKTHNIYCFHEWDVSLIHLFYDRHKIQNMLDLSLEKIYVACRINCTSQLICLRASLHECNHAWVSLTSLHLEAKFNKTKINFIVAAIVH